MTTRNRLTASISIVALALAGLVVLPDSAEAQRRGSGQRPRGGQRIIGGGGLRIGSGLGVATLGQRSWGQYGPWGYPRSYGYYTPFNEFSAAARVEVEPKHTEVYVDGSFAGLVDDFDGFWQRLNLRPGDHVIALYLDGHRTVRHELYFAPGVTHSIKGTMEKLGAGESAGTKPTPAPPTDLATAVTQRNPRGAQYPPTPPAAQAPQPERFGTIALRVTPADAEILVDGVRWTSTATDKPSVLAIKLSAGRHQIEVRKDGFTTYTETVLIRPDGTMTLNVALTKK